MKNSSGAMRCRPARESVSPPTDPRLAAYEVLRSVEEKGAYADRALDGKLSRQPGLDDRDRGLATELVYGVLRRRGTLDRALEPYARKSLDRVDPEILRLLRIGAYQILFLDRVPDHAAVHVSVELSNRVGRPGAGRFVNAVLRSLCRAKGEKGREDLVRQAAQGRADFPSWLVDLWKSDLGAQKTNGLLAALLQQPEILLRANSLKTDRDGLIESLGREGLLSEPVRGLPSAVRLLKGGDIRRTRCYQDGLCIQQDGASQLIVDLLAPRPGERVLDLCAAPGVKTTHIGATMENAGLVVAQDLNLPRLRELRTLCQRLGVSIAAALCTDAARPESLCLPEGFFDRILVDAPCSGLGVLRRSPEKKWRSAPDFGILAETQARLIAAAASLLRKGGVLLYSTCTVNRRENEEVIQGFLARHPDFAPEDLSRILPVDSRDLVSEAGAFCSWNRPAAFDFFYAARLRRLG